MTPSEGKMVFEELNEIDEEAEVRMAEAFHNVHALSERLEKKRRQKTVPPQNAWLALARKMDPGKARLMELDSAAAKFLEKLNARR